jgi:hypothetical protein
MNIGKNTAPSFGFDSSPPFLLRIVVALIFSLLIIALVDIIITFASSNVVFCWFLRLLSFALIGGVFYLNLQEGFRVKGISRTSDTLFLSANALGGGVHIPLTRVVSEGFYDIDGFYTYTALVRDFETAAKLKWVHQVDECVYEINYPLGMIAPDDFSSSAFVQRMCCDNDV